MVRPKMRQWAQGDLRRCCRWVGVLGTRGSGSCCLGASRLGSAMGRRGRGSLCGSWSAVWVRFEGWSGEILGGPFYPPKGTHCVPTHMRRKKGVSGGFKEAGVQIGAIQGFFFENWNFSDPKNEYVSRLFWENPRKCVHFHRKRCFSETLGHREWPLLRHQIRDLFV